MKDISSWDLSSTIIISLINCDSFGVVNAIVVDTQFRNVVAVNLGMVISYLLDR